MTVKSAKKHKKHSYVTHKIDGIEVRFKELGKCCVEVLTSNHKRGLQKKILKEIDELPYTEEAKPVQGGNVKFKLKMSGGNFHKLIETVAYVIATCVDQFKNKPKKTAFAQSRGKSSAKRRGNERDGYRMPSAVTM